MQFDLSKSTTIDAPMADVVKYINELNNWSLWSPWLCVEPECKLDHTHKSYPPSDYMKWDGAVVGSGSLAVDNRESGDGFHHIYLDLSFSAPWKSKAKTSIKLSQESADKTEVIWQMTSSLPWFLFFLKNMMVAMIEGDYERGLARLKHIVEKGAIPVHMSVRDGLETLAGFSLIGIRESAHKSELGSKMGAAFERLFEQLDTWQLSLVAPSVSLYNKVDMIKNQFDYTVGAPIAPEKIDTVKSELSAAKLITCTMTDHQAVVLDFHGSYDFLGDGWAAAMMHTRARKHKLNKKQAAYELYIKGPHNEEDPEKYITQIVVPVK